MCDCHNGFEGKRCERPIDYCAIPGTCTSRYHGSTCINIDYSLPRSQRPTRATCVCETSGYRNNDCDDDIDECAVYEDCLEPARFRCRNQHCGGEFCARCRQPPECVYPCAFLQGSCINTVGSFRCNCGDGFTGALCEQDIDECNLAGFDIICASTGLCANTHGSYRCDCLTGYQGIRCNLDINECTTRAHECSGDSLCVNNRGSYECICNAGYEGRFCNALAIDECENDAICSSRGVCSNTPVGSFTCTCQAGYTGLNCEADVDECSAGVSGGSRACAASPGDCQNTLGSYTCDASCAERDACSFRGVCRSGDDSFVCDCDVGWVGNRCQTDIDECSQQGQQACSLRGTCTNTPGSFRCNCPLGRTGTRCETQVNSCNDGYDVCGRFGSCSMTTAGQLSCSCEPGYTGSKCEQDVDECASSPGGSSRQLCANGGTCSNVVGSFVCDCAPGFAGSTCERNAAEARTGGEHTGTYVIVVLVVLVLVVVSAFVIYRKFCRRQKKSSKTTKSNVDDDDDYIYT